MARSTPDIPKEIPEEASPPDPVTPTPEQLEEGEFVKHVPLEFFGARVISKEDWASIGIDQGTVEWNHLNQFKLPKSMFSSSALNYLINIDDGFEIVSK